MQAGVSLIIVLPAPANVHYGFDGWQNVTDAVTTPNALGVHVMHVDTSKLKPGQRLDFTYWNLPSGRIRGSRLPHLHQRRPSARLGRCR